MPRAGSPFFRPWVERVSAPVLLRLVKLPKLVPFAVMLVVLIAGIFIADIGGRWWRENEWRRRWKNRADDD